MESMGGWKSGVFLSRSLPLSLGMRYPAWRVDHARRRSAAHRLGVSHRVRPDKSNCGRFKSFGGAAKWERTNPHGASRRPEVLE